MAKKKESEYEDLWEGVTEEDFLNGGNVEEVDTIDYDTSQMVIAMANMNYFRQLPRLSDSLKPVERRILMAIYNLKAIPGKEKKKSNKIIGDTIEFHPHSDDAAYSSEVNMAQYWRRNIPLIDGKGNFGTSIDSNGYADRRYTEAMMSKYAYECFFEDYDPDCVEMIYNEGAGENEPASLPSKFPNILINGAFALALGNMSCVPPYNVGEVMKLTRKLLHDPMTEDCYLIPDFPSSCDIVDNGACREIAEKGEGTILLQSTIEVVEGVCRQGSRKTPAWELHIRNLPWLVDLPIFNTRLAELIEKKVTTVIDVQDHSKKLKDGRNSRIDLDYVVYIDKAHDPYLMRELMWKKCGLRKPLNVNFKAVEEGFSIGEMNIRTLLLAWIDERRAYKRRLYNKKLNQLTARIDFLRVFLDVTQKSKINKTIDIIRNSETGTAREKLMKLAEMSSYQADQLLDTKINRFTLDVRKKYQAEIEKSKELISYYTDLVRDPKKIDEKIDGELKCLKEYVSDRHSHLVAENGFVVLDTNHVIMVTKQGYVKKTLYDENKSSITLGALKSGDYPNHYLVIRNTEIITFVDSLGKVTCIPVYEIPTTDTNQYGTPVYDLTRLDGEIISIMPYFSKDFQDAIEEEHEAQLQLITLSADGYFKKTSLEEMRTLTSMKAVRMVKLRDGDKIIHADVLLSNRNALIYTKQGFGFPVSSENIPVASRTSQGLLAAKLYDGDECLGMTTLWGNPYLIILTDKGNMKKISMEYLKTAGKRRDAGFIIAALDPGDHVNFVCTARSKVKVITRTGNHVLSVDDIPELGTRAKCKKLIPIPVGSNIISVIPD